MLWWMGRLAKIVETTYRLTFFKMKIAVIFCFVAVMVSVRDANSSKI